MVLEIIITDFLPRTIFTWYHHHIHKRRRTVVIISTLVVLSLFLSHQNISALFPQIQTLLYNLMENMDMEPRTKQAPSLADIMDGSDVQAAISSTRMRGKFILLGDSITQLSFSASLSGWGAHLADVYQRRVDVYNRGFGGYNTDWFLQYLQTPEGKHDIWDLRGHTNDSVKLVTIFFGANDASDETLNLRHHVPLERFEQNLRTIANLCRENFGHDVRMIFITPPPVYHKSRIQYQIQRYGAEKATGKLERTLELSGLYADVVCKVAKDLHVPCLHLWKQMQDESPPTDSSLDEDQPWGQYLNDGLHLSQLGNTFLAQRLVTLIQQSYPDIAVHPCSITGYTANSASSSGIALHSVGPWHDHIDHLDAQAAFDNRSTTSSIK